MAEGVGSGSYRAGPGARWLPRALSGAVLAGATLAAWHLDASGGSALLRAVRPCIVAAGGLFALGLLRYGAEVRQSVRIGAEALTFTVGRQERSLRYDEIVRWGWSAPFQGSRHWLPALTLLDRFGRVWRVSGLIDSGDRLVRAVLERADRNDLRAWAEQAGLERRMARVASRLIVGYALAALVALAAAIHVWGR